MPSYKSTSVIAALDRGLEMLQVTLLVTSILAMAALNIGNVIGRNLLDYSLPFAAEINRLLIVLLTFVGVGYAARRRRHIRMSAFSERLRGRASRAWELTTLLATGALLLAFGWYALEYVLRTANIGGVTPALRIPLYLIYAVVPLGLILAALQFLLNAVRHRGEIPAPESEQ